MDIPNYPKYSIWLYANDDDLCCIDEVDTWGDAVMIGIQLFHETAAACDTASVEISRRRDQPGAKGDLDSRTFASISEMLACPPVITDDPGGA